MANWDYPGSRWWRCDLHVHTPASVCFKERDLTPRVWVDAALDARVEVVAVTDHNGGSWIDEVKQAAAGHRLVVFPGAEITADNGSHVLALLDPAVGGSAVAALLGACGLPGDRHGVETASTTRCVADLAKIIEEHGGVCIPAHADGEKGFLHEYASPGSDAAGRSGSPQLVRAVTSPHVLGVEVRHDDPQLLRFVDNSLREYHRSLGPLPLLESSDAHRRSDIGSRWTWVKMSRPDLDGLRLALLDGTMSVVRSSQRRDDPNAHARTVIEAIEACEARYLGRGAPFRIQMNPWLNAIIGTRGTGKSTVLEFVRTTMGRLGELDAFSEDFRRGFRKYREPTRTRKDQGLIRDETVLRVTLRRDGTRFRAQWSQKGDVAPIEVETADGWVASPGDVRARFPVRILSQGQLFELAERQDALLQLIDESPDVDGATWRVRHTELSNEYLRLRALSRQRTAECSDEDAVRGRLDDVQRQIDRLEDAGRRDVLARFRVAESREAAIERWQASARARVSAFAAATRDLAADDLPPALFPTDAPGGSPEAAVIAAALAVRQEFASIREAARILVAQAEAGLDALARQLTSPSQWAAHVAEVRSGYAALVDAGAGDEAGDYAGLVARREAESSRLREILEARVHAREAATAGDELLSQISEHRRELTRRRRAFLDRILAGSEYVQVDLTPMGDREDAERRLREAIGGTDRFESDVLLIEEDGTGRGVLWDAYQSTNALEQGIALAKKLVREAIEGTGAGPLSGKFVQHLRKQLPVASDHVMLLFPEDAVEVRHRGPGGFEPVRHGSPGQKAAAILALLLAFGDEPLIVDQPESDLDNQLISNLVVRQLQQNKARRQIIVVTHNPNVVVNGDAELVLPFEAVKGRTVLRSEGGLQERDVRDVICRVMEGGREALDRRYRRITGGLAPS